MDTDPEVRQKKASTGRRWLRRTAYGILAVVCAILGLSAAGNLFPPTRSDPIDRLSDLDKARIAEALRLRRTFGDLVWPGWSNANIPLILYNEAYAFLCGADHPGPGWRTVPGNRKRGGQWAAVPDIPIDGRQYYRQRLVGERASPQAFTVRVGDLWAASMITRDWTKIKMGNDIRDGFPSVIKAFVPYRLIARMFLGLAMNGDGYICVIEHESFHAYQGIVSANRLADAETALIDAGAKYPWADSQFNEQWKAELNALADALPETQEKSTADSAARFISLRRARRLAFHLDSAMVDLERAREWEEGLAKYAELAIWKCAASDPAYKPVQALSADPDFHGYRTFAAKWAEERATLRLQSHAEDNRFYYSGMAQAFLLDRLNPGWKKTVMQNVFLEDLLSQALNDRSEP